MLSREIKLAKLKVVWIISSFDPIQIQIIRIRRRGFNIGLDVDNLNLIVCECGVGYNSSEIR